MRWKIRVQSFRNKVQQEDKARTNSVPEPFSRTEQNADPQLEALETVESGCASTRMLTKPRTMQVSLVRRIRVGMQKSTQQRPTLSYSGPVALANFPKPALQFADLSNGQFTSLARLQTG